MDAGKALRVWGLCHQLRMDEDDSAITKPGRRADRIARIRRDRDMFVAFYSQYTERGQLTPEARARVNSVKVRAEKEIQGIRRIGFSGPLISQSDPYARGRKATKPQINPESGVALLFLTIEDYLARKPMSRAMAWHVYVEGRSVRSFRYGEVIEGKDHVFCGSGAAAGRVHLNLKRWLETLFAYWETL